MKKVCLLVIAFTGLTGMTSRGQAPFHVWTGRIPNSNYGLGPSTVEITYDGGFVTAANVGALTALSILKFSPTGVLEWSRDFATSYGQCAGFATCQLNDSGYVAVGITGSPLEAGVGLYAYGSPQVYAVRTDKNGNLLWANTYSPGDMISVGYWVQQSLDGGVVIGGYTTGLSGPEQGLQNACLIKTDINGNLQWNKQYSFPGYTSALIAYTGAQLSDSSFILGCNSSNGGVLIKTDQDGNVLWSKQYNFDNNTFTALSMRVTSDNGFILAGYVSYPNWALVKIDATGAVQWANSYAPTFPQPYGEVFDVEQLNYGYALVGFFYDSTGYSTSYLVKTDPDGNMLWNRTFKDIYWDWLNSVKQTADGGLVMWGMNWNINSQQRGALIKTDSMGLGTCEYSTQAMAATGYTASMEDITLTVTSGFTQSASPNNYPLTPSPEYFPCAIIPVANFSATDTVTCIGSQVTFTDLSANQPTTWNWAFAGGTPDTSSAENPTVTYDSSGVYDVTLIVSNASGADTLTITQNITVGTTAISGAITGPRAICEGDSAQLSDTGSTGSIQWQSSSNGVSFANISGDTSSTIHLTGVSQTTYYRVDVTGSCGTDSSSPFKLVVNPVLIPVITTVDSIICSNDSTQVCTSNNFAAYSWNTGDSMKCATVKQAGNYYVTVTDNNGCTAQSKPIAISVYAVPSVSIIQNGDTLSSFGQISYQWLLNGNPINNATASVFIAKQQGSYSVEVTDSDGCTAISTPVNVTVTSVSDLADQRISLYPNPSTGVWQLVVGGELLGSRVEVIDEQGQIVFRSEIRSPKSEIGLNVATGIYWLRISNENTAVVKKLIKL